MPTTKQIEEFQTYFNVADEISPCFDTSIPVLTLADISPRWIKKAKAASEALGLVWPPAIGEAEEFLNAHREYRG